MPHNTPSSHRPQVWPVLHLSTLEVALANAAIAERSGCAGVFVISMDGRDDQVVPVAVEVKRRHPALKVGVNLLGARAFDALKQSIEAGLDATWTDRSGVTSAGISEEANTISQLLWHQKNHAFFGSVAFKYQASESNPPAAALAAATLGMIPTTSGPATGAAPDARKLAAMRQVLGDAPLAVASGITPDNAYELGRFVSHILVATGVSRNFHELDEALLVRLLEQLQDF